MSKKWTRKTGVVYAKRQCHIPLERVCECIGQAHYIETDPLKTHSGHERFWVFDVGNDLALCFQYFDPIGKLIIGTNKQSNIHIKILERFVDFQTENCNGIMWE